MSQSDFLGDLVKYAALGDTAIGLIFKVVNGVQEIRKTGREPTQNELHQIALESRVEFDALPKP